MVRVLECFLQVPYPGRSSSTVPPTNSGDCLTHACLGVLTARTTPTAQAGRKSWYVSATRGKKRSRGPELPRKIREQLVPFPPSLFFEKGNLTRCMAVSVLDCLCNNAISSATERAKTTTIALRKASTDSLTSWKLTPNTDTSSARCFTAASSCS